MKYFIKQAISITTSNKVDVIARTKGLTLESRTTPQKPIRTKSSTGIKQKIQQPITKTGKFMDSFDNVKYILKHKAYIIGPGRQLGLGYKQLLSHDNSKFSKEEFGPYTRYWYGDRGITGTMSPEVMEAFKHAVVESHYKKNPHHTRNHVGDDDFKYKLEEIVDWYAASKAQSSNPSKHPSFRDWYLQKRDYFLTHPIKPVDPYVDQYIINSID